MTVPFPALNAALASTPPEAFQGAAPFPHIVIDGGFDPAFVRQLHAEALAQPVNGWEVAEGSTVQRKLRSTWASEYDVPAKAQEVVRYLNSGTFLRQLSRLSGIPHLIADPYFTGGGYNLSRRGDFMDVHVDGNWHDAMAVHRRLNAILYLNPDWREEWGAELRLFAPDGATEIASISPFGGRLVLFETHDLTFHGCPGPYDCPADQARTSIILYYYTAAARPAEHVIEARPHSALWRSNDWLDARGNTHRHAYGPML